MSPSVKKIKEKNFENVNFIMLRSELENLHALLEDTSEWRSPNFFALAYYFLHETEKKDKIAEMELSAYRRAKQIEEDAKTELQKLRRQSLETIEQVRRQLEETKENYRVMLARSQQESQEMARRAGEVIGEIDRISASLGKNTTEKSKNGLRDVLNSLRPKTEEN